MGSLPKADSPPFILTPLGYRTAVVENSLTGAYNYLYFRSLRREHFEMRPYNSTFCNTLAQLLTIGCFIFIPVIFGQF